MRILAIDPGQRTGWAVYGPGGLESYGTFKIPAAGHLGRWAALDRLLWEVRHVFGGGLSGRGPGPRAVIAAELVQTLRQFSSYASAAMHANVHSRLQTYCDASMCIYAPVAVGTWKKAVGSKGRDTAEHKNYVAAVNEKLGLSLRHEDHDAAAAIGVGYWACKEFGQC